MGHPNTTIEPPVAAFIRAQHVFFVATAPLKPDGLINLSPKGLDTFTILDERTVAYLDLTGSGVETIAHLKENGRIVVMFCAFEGPPKIVRLHGRGESVEPGTPDFETLLAGFAARPGTRAVIRVHVQRVSTSCGFGVPIMEHRAERSTLDDWAREKGEDGVRAYQLKKNRFSLDGLPGLRT